MKLGILKETSINEYRVAITPEVSKLFISKNVEIIIERDAGLLSGYSNEDYSSVGATLASKEEIFACDIILKVNPFLDEEIAKINSHKIILSNMQALFNKAKIADIASKNIEMHALELMPRISRAQSMDILSSQSNLMGYMAVIQGAYHSNRVFPLMMTSAGTIPPAKVFIIGVGVAGLQAIATAKRLGCMVSAYDVRPETKEQVESLGAKFISIENSNSSPSVYAKEMSEEYKVKEKELLNNHISKQDVIITTALIMGKKSPILIDANMFNNIKSGATIIDLAIENGGNCEFSEKDKIIEKDNKKIVAINLLNFVPKQASQLFAKNIYNFLSPHIKENGEIVLNYEDDIIKGTLLAKEGKVVHSLLS